MLALMGLFVPVASLIPVHGAVQLGSNTGRAWHQRAIVRIDIAVPFIAGSVVGAIVGAFLVVQLPDALLKLVLAVSSSRSPGRKSPASTGWARPAWRWPASALALLSMLVGATGPLVSVSSRRFLANDRKALVATHAAAMTVQHGLKIVVFGLAGFAFWEWLPLIAAMIAVRLSRHRLRHAAARTPAGRELPQWFRIGITVLALDLLRRGADGV